MTEKAKDKREQAAAAAAQEYDADIYFYSGGVHDVAFGKIAGEIAKTKSRPNGLLILVTNGGYANPAYQIARLFQNTYEKFILYTPSYCKSAGTIIALGANRLLMDSFSELGPLDVQLPRRDEIMARKSGLLLRSSFQSLAEVSLELYEHFMLRITTASGGMVSFKLASELSATMASNLLAPIYGQINPEVVGSDYRDLKIAQEYGQRLVDISGNATLDGVLKLIHGYPAHNFIIDATEASTIFKYVDLPSEPLYEIVGSLGDAAFTEEEPAVAIALSPQRGTTTKSKEDGNAPPAIEPNNEARTPLDGSGGGNQPSDPGSPEQGGPAGKPSPQSAAE